MEEAGRVSAALNRPGRSYMYKYIYTQYAQRAAGFKDPAGHMIAGPFSNTFLVIIIIITPGGETLPWRGSLSWAQIRLENVRRCCFPIRAAEAALIADICALLREIVQLIDISQQHQQWRRQRRWQWPSAGLRCCTLIMIAPQNPQSCLFVFCSFSFFGCCCFVQMQCSCSPSLGRLSAPHWSSGE